MAKAQKKDFLATQTAAEKSINLQQTLTKFYQNPVAKVSMELFMTAGAVIFFALFAIRPTLLTMSDLLKEIDDKQQLDEQLSRKAAALQTVQAEYFQLQEDLPVLAESLPANPELLYSLKVIEKLASDEQLVIDNLSIAVVPSESASAEADLSQTDADNLDRSGVVISLSVKGPYTAIRSFIESVQDYRRLFLVQTVSFTIQESQAGSSLGARIVINAPYLETDAPSSPDDSSQTRSTQPAEDL